MSAGRLAAVLALSVLAACGGGGGGGEGGQTADPSGKVTMSATTTSDPVGGGESVQFDVVLSNTSSAAADNVAASLALGPGLTRTSLTCTPAGGASCPADAASMSVPSLPVGGSLHFQIVAALASGSRGDIASTASVSAGGQAASTVPLHLQAFTADVQVSAQSPSSTLQAGGAAAYTMTVSNAGPDAAHRVDLINLIDSQQALGAVSCAASGGATCPATLGDHMTVDTLPVGGALVFTVPATIAADASGLLAETMVAQAPGDATPANNAATASATVGVAPQGPTSFIAMQSDSGDFVGAGRSWVFTQVNAVMQVTAEDGRLRVYVTGDHSMQADFAVGSTRLQSGDYPGLQRYVLDGPVAGMDVSADGNGCNVLAGSFAIDAVTYSGSTLTAVDLHFEQHCEGAVPALRGRIHWLASDASAPPGPVTPAPAGLWQAPAGALPATGTYLYLQSDAGDFVGQGGIELYTAADALLQVRTLEQGLSVSYTGDRLGAGSFVPMSPLTQLQAGYYGNATGGYGSSPARGQFDWGGDARGCNAVTGWFVVDHVEYTAGVVSALDLRFEQHCEGAAPALHGQLHWFVGDTITPPGPQDPPPSALWRAPAGATPATGNYVYLEGDSGNYVSGGGGTFLYTQANAVLSTSVSNGVLSVGVNGDRMWGGSFQGMDTLSQLIPGYYGGLLRYPFNNPTKGGLDWTGGSNGCNQETGWFVVDGIGFTAGVLTSIDLRFEQYCDGSPAALHGQVHWAAGDPTAAAGPQNPAPAGLWSPPAGATPASGSYVYLQSDAGDYVGGGQTLLYQAATTSISVTGAGREAAVIVGPSSQWMGNFAGMNSTAHLQPGYYGHLLEYPSYNPAFGGLAWFGQGNRCDTATGWFVVDAVTYTGDALATLDLRFEQHCSGDTPALHGKIHWTGAPNSAR